MGIYGEIENIEFHSQQPSFAFVKFKKVVNALKAYDNQKTLSLLLNQPSLKIMFAEHEKVENLMVLESSHCRRFTRI
jgi:hypothetical protein